MDNLRAVLSVSQGERIAVVARQVVEQVEYLRRLHMSAHLPSMLVVGGGDVGIGFLKALFNEYPPKRGAAHVRPTAFVTTRTEKGVARICAELGLLNNMEVGVWMRPLLLDPSNWLDCVGLAVGFKMSGHTLTHIVLSAGEATPDSQVPQFAEQEHMRIHTSQMYNFQANVEPKKLPFSALLQAGLLTNAHIVVVSSIAALFDPNDEQCRDQSGYIKAMYLLDVAFTKEKRCNPELHLEIWHCPLVQGATEQRYKKLGIVSADLVVPSAAEIARTLLFGRKLSENISATV